MVSYEQLQEKQDEIERLQDLIKMDKEALKEEKKKIADLNEACTLAEERTENAISDREKFHEKNKEFIHKF